MMEDLISQLPDVLLHMILLNLSTRDSVRTSVLSSRWRHLWKRVPGLHLIGEAYTDSKIRDFLHRFLCLHSESPIYQFTLRCNEKDRADVDGLWLEWLIDKVITLGVQCFAIDGSTYDRMSMLPVSFYKCETLVHLWLEFVDLGGFNDCQAYYLPRLETMHLMSVTILSNVVLEMLISHSPLLRVLSIHDTIVGILKLRSQTVTRLSLRRCNRLYGGGDSGVVIDTPRLEFLSIRDDLLENFTLESVSSSIKMCIDVYANMEAFRNFFAGISAGVTDLTISSKTLKGICSNSKLQQLLPEFQNLTHLNACFYTDLSEMLPIYLSTCPNLKSLDVDFHGYPKMAEIASSPVPQCFKTSIEYVEIKMTPGFGQERSRKAETEFAKYILKNATILKKLTLWLDGEEDECSSVLQQILTFPNHSFVEVKMGQLPAKFRPGHVFDIKPFFDPIGLFNLSMITFL